MRKKLNCWEFKNCGREKGGLLSGLLGECPVATAMRYDGTHDGQAAGRICWRVRGLTHCNQTVSEHTQCHVCEFYRRVLREEAENVRYRFASIPV